MQVSCGIDSDAGLDVRSAEELASLLAALGDPVRLRIFSIIAENVEVCSCDLEAPVGKSQPTISHHTAKLAAAGLIVGEKRGRWTWWRIDSERARRASSILGELAQQK